MIATQASVFHSQIYIYIYITVHIPRIHIHMQTYTHSHKPVNTHSSFFFGMRYTLITFQICILWISFVYTYSSLSLDSFFNLASCLSILNLMTFKLLKVLGVINYVHINSLCCDIFFLCVCVDTYVGVNFLGLDIT